MGWSYSHLSGLLKSIFEVVLDIRIRIRMHMHTFAVLLKPLVTLQRHADFHLSASSNISSGLFSERGLPSRRLIEVFLLEPPKVLTLDRSRLLHYKLANDPCQC
jgi:hypothetical protein